MLFCPLARFLLLSLLLPPYQSLPSWIACALSCNCNCSQTHPGVPFVVAAAAAAASLHLICSLPEPFVH
jgi:hypothetical protein